MKELPWLTLIMVAAVPGWAWAAVTANPAVSPTVAESLTGPLVESRIDALQREIAAHDQRYFRHGAPIISDAEYDDLKRELRQLEVARGGANEPEAGEGLLGDDRWDTEETIRHHQPMLSLGKAYTATEVEAFHERLVQRLGRDDIVYVVEPKYDGIAVSLQYERGQFVRAATRGNGEFGADVTRQARQIEGWPRSLRLTSGETAPELLELRGEVYLSWEKFHLVNAARQSEGEEPFAHPRSLAAGTLKNRTAGPSVLADLTLVVHGVGAWSCEKIRPSGQTELYARLAGWGVPVVPARRAVGAAELGVALTALGQARSSYPFPTDGAVIKVDAWSDQQELGVTRLAPRWALARKFDPPRAVTQLRAVSWQTGRTGGLTPVAELAPVVIAGSTIRRVSLHHAEEVVRRDLHADDWVVIEMAGEVIPSLVGVELNRRSATSQRIPVPDVCPSCTAPLERVEALRCVSQACPARMRRRLEHFAGRMALEIPLGPRAIETLVGEGRLRTLPDLYRLDAAVLDPVVGIKGREAVLAALAGSRQAPLEQVLVGLGLPHVGPVAAHALARHFGTLDLLLGATREELRAVSGFAPGRADSLYQALQDTATQEEGRELLRLGVGSARPQGRGELPQGR